MAKYQKRTYEFVAAMLRDERESFPHDKYVQESMERMAYRFASIFAEDNPQFDRVKFFDACGIVEGDE
jgi:hypothetical protein